MNLVAINIGNSRISCALFIKGMLAEAWHYPTCNAEHAARQLSKHVGATRIAICSVVPDAARVLSEILSEEASSLELIDPMAQSVIGNIYKTMGADRVANAAAGWALFGRDAPVLVLDLGTATTLTAVSADGKFSGGLITLGLGSTIEALYSQAAQLPELDLVGRRPSTTALAFDTEEAMASGTIIGHLGLVESWIQLGRRKLGSQAVTVATGGWAELISSYTRSIEHIDPYLTLKGIYLIAEAATVPAGRD